VLEGGQHTVFLTQVDVPEMAVHQVESPAVRDVTEADGPWPFEVAQSPVDVYLAGEIQRQ
jgi:hypothetical protein